MLGISDLQQGGTVGINTEYNAGRKPLWLVALKLLGVAAMVAVGGAIAVPSLLELDVPPWQAIAYTAGGMCVYVGIAFFIRPEPNTDNMDSANRFLWRLHCLLGPGRFTAETFLDTCALVGLAKTDEAAQPAATPPTFGGYAAAASAGPSGFDATRPIAPLDPNRFALSSAGSVTEKIMRDSQRFVPSQPPASAG